MKIAIVIDSSCDLPEDLIYQYDIREVPFKVIVQNTVRYDNRLDFHREDYYEGEYAGKGSEMTVEPPTTEDFLQVYKKLCLTHDAVISLHQSSRISDAAKNARNAATQGGENFRKIRAQRNISTPFQVRVIDSKNTSIGLGLLVIRAAELLTESVSFTKLAMELESLADQVFLYIVPDNVGYIRAGKSRKKISFLEASLSSALDRKTILMYNKGDVQKLDQKKGYDTAVKEIIRLSLDRLREKTSYDKIGIVYAGQIYEVVQMQAIADFRVELAGTGLGSLISTMNPLLTNEVGPKAIGIAIINGDINAAVLTQRN
jgi:DegV family protein with EDD domain